jgi:penicillin amidase
MTRNRVVEALEARQRGGRNIFRAFPLTSRFAVFVFVPLLTASVAVGAYLRASLPLAAGTLQVAALHGSTVITRDRHGVVFIKATTDADAFFALGFAHAQDRMWQLEMERRIAQGTLSEVVGRGAIAQDAWMRTLGLYESARSSWSSLSPQARASLTSYAAGINAWLKTRPVLPPEFLALGVKLQPWTELDSLAWVKVFALNLGGNMREEMQNLVASEMLDQRQLAGLAGLGPADMPDTKLPPAARTAADDLVRLQSAIERSLQIGGAYVGSNSWVVSGRLMSSGTAALANDTHMGLEIPSPWYVAHLSGDKLDVSGMTLVGLPLVIFGRNRDIAWGGTSLRADVQDLYFEQVNPSRPTQYKAGDGWLEFGVRTELVRVRADFPASLRPPQQPVKLRVRTTRNGPIVSDLLGITDQPVALQWTALEPGEASYESFFRLQYAYDWSSFSESFRAYVAPTLNMLYADRNGNIGCIAVGRIPIRSRGKGRVPVPGWSGEYHWSGYIPFEQLPRQYNPQRGYIVSANEKVVGDDYPYFISDDWAPPERAERIDQLLREATAGGRKMAVEELAHMQADTLDLGAARLVQLLKRTAARGQREQEAVGYVDRWGGDMARDSQGAAIFFVWTRYLRQRLFGDNVAAYWNRPQQSEALDEMIAGTSDAQLADALTDPHETWCQRRNDEGAGSCGYALRRSLEEAVAELTRLEGTAVASWKWGSLHKTWYAHLPFSQTPAVASLFERRISNGGSPNTVDAANGVYRESVGYEQTRGPGFRQVIQMGRDGVRHLYMNSTGQSGNALSAHYADMVRPFRDAQSYPLEPDTQGQTSLTLTPARR